MKLLWYILLIIFWNISGAVGIPQASPTRDSHRGSPMMMDENKSRQSPGMADNQSGQSRNMFSQQEVEEVKRHQLKRFAIDKTNQKRSISGRSVVTATFGTRLSCVYSTYRSNAIMVLGLLSTSGECLSSISQDRSAHSLTINSQGKRWHLLQRTILQNRASARLQHNSWRSSLRPWRLQCAVMARNGLKYSRSAFLFTNSCTNVDATISLTHCASLKWRKEETNKSHLTYFLVL